MGKSVWCTYGTDAISSEKLDNRYNPVRGGKVIRYCRIPRWNSIEKWILEKVNTLKIIANKLVLKLIIKILNLKTLNNIKDTDQTKKKLKGFIGQ